MHFRHAVLALALVHLACTAAGADLGCPWPQFHGPDRTNRSAETGLLKSWPPAGPRLLWTAKGLGEGFSSIAVANGLIYTAGMVQDETFVLALNPDGSLRWRKSNGPSWSRALPSRFRVGYRGTRATPTAAGRMVYHLSELGKLTAFGRNTGKPIWTVDLTKAFEAKVPLYGYAESVTIDRGRLICYPGGPKGYMVALDPRSGDVLWANRDIQCPAAYCTPIVVDACGFRQAITMNPKAVLGVDAHTGRLLWSHPHANNRGNNIATPIYHDGCVYVSTGYGAGGLLLKLSTDGKRVAAKQVWTSKGLDSHHGGVILHEGCLYGAGHYARGWWCLDWLTGAARYRDKTAQKGSATYADGMLYCLGEKGLMSRVKHTHSRY